MGCITFFHRASLLMQKAYMPRENWRTSSAKTAREGGENQIESRGVTDPVSVAEGGHDWVVGGFASGFITCYMCK